MKSNMQKNGFLLLAVFSIFLLTNCSEDGGDTPESNDLIGTWTQTAQAVDITIGTKTFVEYLMEEEQITEAEAEFAADYLLALFNADNSFSTITFNSNGTYVIKATGMADDTGTWKLSSDKKNILFDEGTVDEANIDVISLTANKLDIRIIEDASEDLEVEGAQMEITMSFTK